jgi:hypothetical protein
MTGPLHLDYATRDYDGFRQLLISVIDRQGTAWSERAAADLGIMVVELLAYELDRLAYAGDRAAEEGFLATARRRESARRHAALGDYVLDRGNATRGYQWFQLSQRAPLALPARTPVAAPIDPSEIRLFAETLDAVNLDARRNWFALSQTAPAGEKVLRLASGDGQLPDLRSLGLAAGMTLIVGTPLLPGQSPVMPDAQPLQLALGEDVRIARVLPHGVELEQALRNTWPGGDQGAVVLGNIVEIRRGLTSDWTAIGNGGAGLGDIANEQFLQLRMDVVRRLRAEVEDARAAWIGRPALADAWTAACQAVTVQRRKLAQDDLSAYDARDPAQRAELQALAAPLDAAADAFRDILTKTGREVPDELQRSERVAVKRQTIDLPFGEQPVLWMDRDPAQPARSETLMVAVGVAGAWTRWTEQPDLLRSAPDAHDYVVEIDGNSRVTLRFGDGESGAVLPADCQVMARWVTGDEAGDDLRAGALGVLATAGPQPASVAATSNPLPTTGGRAPEDLDGIAARVELGLEAPAIPVTGGDYQLLLGRRPGIAESAVAIARGVVDIVIRPAAGVAAPQLLDQARAWLDTDRLAGATVMVRLPRSLPIDIGLVVDVHPDVSAADLRYRVQRALIDAFGDAQPQLLGRARERAEIYRLVENIPGVLWSQLIAFDRAGHTPSGVLEVIVPAPDQVIRCAGSEEQPAGGQVTIWAARRFSLQLTVEYDTLDTRPDLAAIRRLLPALLSGPASLPVQRGWTVLTAQRIEDALVGVLGGAGSTVTVTRLIADRRAIAELDLGDRELPILDTATVVDGGLRKPA